MGSIGIAGAVLSAPPNTQTVTPPSKVRQIKFNHDASTSQYTGDGITVLVNAIGGNHGALLYQAPHDANPVALQIGGASPQQSYLYEYGGSTTLGDTDQGPINLSQLSKWEANVVTGTRFFENWLPNTRVIQGAILLNAGHFFLAMQDSRGITGATAPAFNNTPGSNTTDGSVTWVCVGITRPITFSDMFIGIADYQGTNIGGSGYYQVFVSGDPTNSFPGPAYNFIGFHYIPEPLSVNNNVGDNQFFVYVGGANMVPVRVPTGVQPTNDGTNHVFTIEQPSPNKFTFFIDGLLVATINAGGLTNPFFSVIYGNNTQGDNDAVYGAKPYGLGGTTFKSGVWWQAAVAGTALGTAIFDPTATFGETIVDGGVTWLAVWGDTSAALPPMAYAVSSVYWITE
jgi:hypothetical protein